jgi:hypothetical protein
VIALDRSQSEGVDNAEDCFLTALSTALAQNAKWWELRIATSLARVWRGQGRARESRELLDPVLRMKTHCQIRARKFDALTFFPQRAI